MDKNKLSKIVYDEEFIKKILEQETDEGFKNVLSQKGIDISLEEATDARKKLIGVLKGEICFSNEEILSVTGGKGNKIGSAIKYVFGTTLALSLLGGIMKVSYDIYDLRKKENTLVGKTGRAKYELGGGSWYQRLLYNISDKIGSVSGGKNVHTEQKSVGKSILKGFGLKNGKLF